MPSNTGARLKYLMVKRCRLCRVCRVFSPNITRPNITEVRCFSSQLFFDLFLPKESEAVPIVFVELVFPL